MKKGLTEIQLDRLFDREPKIDEVFLEIEKHFIRKALENTKGNKTDAAVLLGWNYQKINYRMKKLGMAARDR